MVEFEHYEQRIRVPLLGEISIAATEPDVESLQRRFQDQSRSLKWIEVLSIKYRIVEHFTSCSVPGLILLGTELRLTT
jgi:hypothetical protein